MSCLVRRPPARRVLLLLAPSLLALPAPALAHGPDPGPPDVSLIVTGWSFHAEVWLPVIVAAWGYRLAFHFDPMVIYEDCEEDYRRVITRMVERIPARQVVWVSLGTFRFMPALKPIVEARFPDSKIVYGEFVSGLDGKMRYFKPLRIALYRKMAAWLREALPGAEIYFCMEDDEVWERCLGFTPQQRGGLSRMLDESAVRHCGIRAG